MSGEYIPYADFVAQEQRRARLTAIGRDLLAALGEDPDRDGLRDTPARWAKFWLEFQAPARDSDEATSRTFDLPGTDQMVAVTGVRVWSLCEHHLLPFYVDLVMAYIPGSRVLGLSKFARLARREAARLQVQERLMQDIARAIGRATGSPDVAVLGSGEHLCMSMRGVRSDHRMHSHAITGAFKNVPEARQELLNIVGASRHG